MPRREYDYIKGNTVLAPERKSRIRKPDKKFKRIQKINKNALLKRSRKNDRKYLFSVAVLIFSLGIITVTGDDKVYSMQKKVSELNTQIKQTQEQTEAIKVTLLKYSSLNNIQKKAEGQLAMFVPKKDQTVKVDFSENYFEDLTSSGSEQKTKEGTLFSKLANLIKSIKN